MKDKISFITLHRESKVNRKSKKNLQSLIILQGWIGAAGRLCAAVFAFLLAVYGRFHCLNKEMLFVKLRWFPFSAEQWKCLPVFFWWWTAGRDTPAPPHWWLWKNSSEFVGMFGVFLFLYDPETPCFLEWWLSTMTSSSQHFRTRVLFCYLSRAVTSQDKAIYSPPPQSLASPLIGGVTSWRNTWHPIASAQMHAIAQ